MAAGTERLPPLSDPKPLPAGYQEDKQSVYWNNVCKPKNYTTTTKFVLSKRQDELVKPKATHPEYKPPRRATWVITQGALTFVPTQRIHSLSRPKGCHPDYQPGKSGVTSVRKSALMYHPTARIHQLARHKEYPFPNPNVKYEDSDWHNWEQLGSRVPTASTRVLALAEPKPLHDRYKPPRLDFSVSKEAQNCTPTERVIQLSRPRNKHAETEDYNAMAYTVSRSALKAVSSPRINELASPIPRKIRVKK